MRKAQHLVDDPLDPTKSDEEIGKQLLAARLAAELEARGIDPRAGLSSVPAEVFESWVAKIREQEAEAVENMALEKAIVKATHGDFAAAGSIFRAWIQQSAVNAAALDEALIGRRRQKARARRPRPKKKPTHRSIVIAAMGRYRKQSMTLEKFLDAASVGSIDGLNIKRDAAKGVERWIVECDELDTYKRPVARSTLEGWWADANKAQP